MGFRGMEAGHESRFNVHNQVAKEMVKGWKTDTAEQQGRQRIGWLDSWMEWVVDRSCLL